MLGAPRPQTPRQGFHPWTHPATVHDASNKLAIA